MNRNNKLYTKSYFIKRLIEKHFFVTKIVEQYTKNDTRYWTILVNPDRAAIFITCFKERGKVFFRLFGPNDVNMIIETESMDVIISTLYNIISKREQDERA